LCVVAAMATDEFLPKLLRRNVPPQLTLDHVSPATRLLEKRRQKIEVQEALEAQKADFSRREEQFWRREQIIKKKDLDLQENLIRFNKFLQENDTKRTRAEKKHIEEEKKKIEYTQQIEKHKEQLDQLRGENENLQGALEKNQKYMQYLEMTCETTGDEFGEPLELQHRYENQAECNLDLKDRQKTGLKDLNELQTELRKLQMERSTQTQVKNTKIAQMRKRLEESKQQVYNLTHQIEQEEFDRLERTHQMGQVRMALDNTFARCVDRTTLASKKGKMQGVKDAQVQLEFIGEFCCDLQAINEAFKKKRLEHQREATKKKELDAIDNADR